AGKQALLGREAEQLAETKAGVKMVARAGGDLRFGSKRARNQGCILRTGSEGIGGGMDNDGVHRDTKMNFFAEGGQAFGGAIAGVKAKIPANFATLLLVETQRDVEVFLKGGDQFQRAQNIFAGALFGVGEVYE